ncbi:MAG: pilus assembly protein TadG-related protein [Sphingomonas sp.]|uniref:pilus assembly protein TadG-related protein n=1 Tax=Sphingomonas sp. TaxID=28214 RepID=UPI003F7E01A8
MKRAARQLWKSESGSVAPIVAISLFAIAGVAGIGFDYARMASLDTELQDAADQAALAAATQLDGKSDSITRATSAAQSLIANNARFANDGQGRGVTIQTPVFYDGYNQSTDTYGNVTTDPTAAKVVKVTTAGRETFFALTPLVAAFRSGTLRGSATAGLGQAICQVPPVMICTPAETATNTDYNADFTVAAGTGLKLVTGNASAPGNFGWLESNIGSGANALAEALGYNNPLGDCSPITGVTTKTGMSASVLSALNTRFDIFANGNSTCPSQDGGTCSPSANTRKDLVCQSSNGTNCNNDTWTESPNPYRPTTVGALPSTGGSDPDMMGYPRDMCHAVPAGTAGACNIIGNGSWDRDAYFRVNYGYASQSAWMAATGLSATATRYDVYNWELNHQTVVVGGKSRGIAVPQPLSGKNTGFGNPATGRAGLTPGGNILDRRRISAAVLNCNALSVNGKTSQIPVAKWLDLFLVEPSYSRTGGNGANKVAYTDAKEVYVEVIGTTSSGANGATNSQVVERAVPYLIR